MSNPVERLKHHVTGAIERGEKQAIVEQRAPRPHRKDIATAANGVTLEHRHFAFIAATIAAMPDHAPTLRAQKASVATAFADACTGTNPRFDRARFIAACKLSEEQAS